MTFDPDKYIEKGMRYVEKEIPRRFKEDIRKELKMAYTQKELSCTLFPNEEKLKDTHPDLKGKAMVNGVLYWASAWKNKSKDGTKSYLSITFQKVEGKPVEAKGADVLDDEIKF